MSESDAFTTGEDESMDDPWKMDPAIKKRWVGALLSGDYAQTRDALRRTMPTSHYGDDADVIEAGFCCLGVLADILFPNDWIVPTVLLHGTDSTLLFNRCGVADGAFGSLLSQEVMPEDTQRIFSVMNDDKEDFVAIAAKIEETV